MRLHLQAFCQLKSQRISKKRGRNKLMNQLRSDSDFCTSAISRYARNCLNEKLYQNSVFDFGGSDLHQRFCGRAHASELQENR